jgi:hypothetical protein
MMDGSQRILKAWALAGGLLAVAWTPAEACNIPVFRYALENWRPDTYRATVFHRGALTAPQQAVVQAWQVEQQAARLNLTVRQCDVDRLDAAEDRALWASVPGQPLPCVVLQYPAHLRIDSPVWHGPLESETAAALFDSPVRRELVRRLVQGDTAVWLLLDSGDAARDEQAASLLQQELQRLEATLKLPELSDSPDDVVRSSTPLKLAFSVLRVRRNDPAELPLVSQLLGSEPDLAGLTDPMVFPVFGRGRALFGLVGPGIDADNIRGSARFLTGACSCQVKEQNPGFDLLIAVDWADLLALTDAPQELASTTAEPELVPIASGSTPTAVNDAETATFDRMEETPRESGQRSLYMAAFLLACGVLVAAWRR